ncbi:MAG: SRPBCC family protein [Actinomycetota bacterium]
MRISADTVLPVSPEEVWGKLLAWEDQAAWMRDADSVRVLTSHREGVGVVVAVKTRVLNVPVFTERLEVTLWEPPRRLVMAHLGFVRGVGEWALDRVDGGTRLTWTEHLRLPVPLIGELALLAYRPFMGRLMRGSLTNLRALLARERP